MNILNEDKFTELRASIDEVRSSIIVLQQAVSNEFNPAELSDVNNSLELIKNKMNEIVEDADSLYIELFGIEIE